MSLLTGIEFRLAVPLRHVTGFPDLRLLRGLRHRWPLRKAPSLSLRSGGQQFPTFTLHRLSELASSFHPYGPIPKAIARTPWGHRYVIRLPRTGAAADADNRRQCPCATHICQV